MRLLTTRALVIMHTHEADLVYTGLCFSVPPGIAIPPSLRNVGLPHLPSVTANAITDSGILISQIYAEIKQEYPEFEIPKHG